MKLTTVAQGPERTISGNQRKGIRDSQLAVSDRGEKIRKERRSNDSSRLSCEPIYQRPSFKGWQRSVRGSARLLPQSFCFFEEFFLYIIHCVPRSDRVCTYVISIHVLFGDDGSFNYRSCNIATQALWNSDNMSTWATSTRPNQEINYVTCWPDKHEMTKWSRFEVLE